MMLYKRYYIYYTQQIESAYKSVSIEYGEQAKMMFILELSIECKNLPNTTSVSVSNLQKINFKMEIPSVTNEGTCRTFPGRSLR